jgi:copper(I)-binding protein
VNRALRAATVGVLLLTPVALTACGAGQVDQTATQVRDRTGPSAKIGDIYLRQVLLAPPSRGSYAAGDDAELTMSITNGGSTDDALVGIRGEGFSGVRVAGTGVSATPSGTSAPATSAPTTSATATTTAAPPGATPGATTPATTPATTSATGTATATTPATASATVSSAPPTASAASSAVNIAIPAHETLLLGQNAPTVTLVRLDQSLTSAQLLKITFTFRRAGDVTLDVVVAAPTNPAPASTTFNFSEEPKSVFGGQSG